MNRRAKYVWKIIYKFIFRWFTTNVCPRMWWGSKIKPEETIAERVKLNLQERKNEGTRLKFLTSIKLLARLPLLFAQMNPGNIIWNQEAYRIIIETKLMM